MALQTLASTGLTDTFQTFFSKQLLKHAVQLTRLNEFAQQKDLPKNLGTKTIRFFRRSAADASQVLSLTEGTAPATSREINYTPIDATLVQYGEVAKITDILSMTQLFDTLKDSIALMGEDCALHADTITRNVIIAGVTAAGQKRYSGGASTFNALVALSNANGVATINDYLDAMTQLKIQRAPTKSGDYVAVIPPQISRDLLNDDKFVKAGQYTGRKELFKGELGSFYGVRFVEATNPFREANTNGTEGTYASTGPIYTSICTGTDGYGVAKIAGGSPFSPSTVICDKPDKSDPLNQTMTAGWKSFWTAKVLNENYIVTLRSKTAFA